MSIIVSLFKRKGQSVVEFAIVLPIILFVCVAALSVGLFIYCKMLVVTATLQAAKHGAYLYQVSQEPVDEESLYVQIREKAVYYIKKGISVPEGSYISVFVSTEDAVFHHEGKDVIVGKYCFVKVSYPYTFIFPLSDVIFGGTSSIPITYEAKSLYLIR